MAVDRIDGERPDAPVPPLSLGSVPLDDVPVQGSASARVRWALLGANNRLREMAVQAGENPSLTEYREHREAFLAQTDEVLSLLDRLDSSGYLVAVDGR